MSFLCARIEQLRYILFHMENFSSKYRYAPTYHSIIIWIDLFKKQYDIYRKVEFFFDIYLFKSKYLY